MVKVKTTIAIVPESLINNKAISFGAVGLFAVMQQIDESDFYVSEFAKAHDVAVDYVFNMLEELLQGGYIDIHYSSNGAMHYVINA